MRIASFRWEGEENCEEQLDPAPLHHSQPEIQLSPAINLALLPGFRDSGACHLPPEGDPEGELLSHSLLFLCQDFYLREGEFRWSEEVILALVVVVFEGIPQFTMLFTTTFNWHSNFHCVNLELLREAHK